MFLRKHSVDNIEDLIEVQLDLIDKVSKSNNIDSEISSLSLKISELKIVLLDLAKTLSFNRLNAIPKLVISLQEIVNDLGMKSAEFLIEINSQDKLFE
jgi:DNA repair ATPase RecN